MSVMSHIVEPPCSSIYYCGDSDDADDELGSEYDELTSEATSHCTTCDYYSDTDENLTYSFSCSNNSQDSSFSSRANINEVKSMSSHESGISQEDISSTKTFDSEDSLNVSNEVGIDDSHPSTHEYSQATSFCVSDLHTIMGDSDLDDPLICIKRTDVEWQKAVNEYLINEMRSTFTEMYLDDECKSLTSNA